MVERHSDVVRTMWTLLEEGSARVDSVWPGDGPVRLHALEAGQGPPLLLLHGAGGGAANWFATIAALSSAHRVIAPDLPGFGLSLPIEFEPPFGAALARVLLEWLSRRGISNMHVAGTSLGGLIALQMAVRARERLKSVVLIDAAGLGRELPAAVRLATLPGAHGLAGSTGRPGLRLFFQRYLTSSDVPAQRRDKLLSYIRACALAGTGEMLAANIARFASIRGQREVVGDDALSMIAVPLLVLWGERDRFIPPSHGARAAALAADARFVTIPGVGHSPNWEAPDRVAGEILRFTAGLRP